MVAQALTIELSEELLNSIDAAKDDTMSRPKPTIILEHTDNVTYKCEQILEAEAIWAVFYRGKPFNLKSSNILTNYPLSYSICNSYSEYPSSYKIPKCSPKYGLPWR